MQTSKTWGWVSDVSDLDQVQAKDIKRPYVPHSLGILDAYAYNAQAKDDTLLKACCGF